MKTWIASALVMMAPLLAGHAQAQTCTQLPQRITDSTGSSNSLAGWTAADGDGGGTAPTTWTIGALGFNAAQHWDDQTNLAVAPPATSGIDTLTQTTPPTRVSGGSILQFDIAWNNAQYGLIPNAYDGNRAQLTISYAGVTYVRAQTATAIFRANTLANDTDPGPGTATSALVGDANLAILGGATLLAGSMPSPFRAADAGAPVWATITIRLPDNIPQTGAFVIGVQRIQAGFDQNRTDDFYIRNVTLAPRTLCLRKQTPGPGAGGGNFSFTTTNLDTNYTTSQAAAGGPYDNGPLTMNTTGTTPVVLPDPDGGTIGAQPALVMGNTVTVTETIGTTGFALTGATCDNGVIASVTGNQATLTNINAATGAGIMVTCTLTNARPRIRLQKALPNGRALATDQFGLTITGPRGGVGTVATVTTTGTGTTATGTADFTPGDTGGSYTLSETAVGTTVPASYATTYLCTNATAGSTTTMPSGSGATFNLVPAAGDDITCTFTNARQAVTLTLTKISQGGARAFTFTGNNGWTSQTLTTTASGVGVTGATQTLTNAGTATTITETMPSGFVLSNVTCTGMGSGGAVTTGASSFTLNAAAVTGGSNIACTVTNSVESQPAFPTCSSNMYLSQSPNTTTNTTLYNISTSTNPFTFPALGQGSNVYNAIGFNPVDNYIYGINAGSGSGNRLIRVGADGSSVDLGPVAGMATDSWIMGTFSDTGVLYVLAGGGSSSLRAINVQTNTSTLITLSSSVQASDMAWIGGLIYTVQGNGQLRSINPATGAVTNIGALSAAVDYGAMFGSPTGLFASANGGGFYSFDLVTGARTLISGSPGSNVNDGANCPTAPITFSADLSVTKTNTPASGPNDLVGDTYVAGQARTYSVVVTNNGPFGVQNATVTDPVPTGVNAATVSWTCASTSGGAACGSAGGTGALNDTGLDLPAGAVATYQITMTVPAGFSGELTNTVTITPPSTINDGTAANNTATDTDQNGPADLGITKSDGVTQYGPGQMLTYTIVVSNAGPAAANGAVFTDPAVAGLTMNSVACGAATGGAVCPAAGDTTVALMQSTGIVIPTLPAGGSMTFTVTATVASGTTGNLSNTANIAPPTGVTDTVPGNNSATDTDVGPLTQPLSCAVNTLYTIDSLTSLLSQINAVTGASTPIATMPLPPGGVQSSTLLNAMGIPSAGGNQVYIAVSTDNPVGTRGTVLTYNTVTTTWSYSAAPPAADMAAYAGGFVAGAVNPVNGWFYYAISQVNGGSNTVWGLFAYNPATGAAPIRVGEITGVLGNNGDLAFDTLGNLYLLSGNVTTSIRIYRVNGPMPTTSGATNLPGTAITPLISSTVNFGGIAFNNGLLVAQAGTSLYTFDPATGAQVGGVVVSTFGGDLASCAYPNTIRLQKSLPTGRSAATDQFALAITGGGISVGNTATTSGTATGLQPAIAGPVLGQVGTTYTISEQPSGTTALATYTSAWQCVDATNGNAPIASGTGATGSFAMPNGGNAGVDALCTITNTRVPQVDLSITKTNTPTQGPSDQATDTYAPGEVRTYVVVVTHGSTSDSVQDATVSDPIPVGIDAATVSWTCASTSGGAVCGAASGTGALNDTGLDLPPGAVATYRITMTVPVGFTGDLTNTVNVTPPSGVIDSNAANNTATDVDQSAPLLTIRKTSVGGVDSFGFTGTNGVVTQTLVTTVAGTPVSGAAQPLTAAGTATTITESTTPATYRVTDITCTGLGAGGTATLDLVNRTVALNAAATAAGANIVCTFTNTLQQTDIQVVKTASPNPVVSGDVVTYTLVVSNNGPNAVTNAVLSDVPSAGQTCTTPSTTATCTATGGASCPAATVPVTTLLGAGMTIPTLPVGGQVTVTLQCTVSASGQ